jgi:hypothetical protein
MIPAWLHDASLLSLALGGAVAVVIAIDLVRHPQRMWIMNVVWPVTALFAHFLSFWVYWRFGRRAGRRDPDTKRRAQDGPRPPDPPFFAMVAKGALHCGAGCTLGDLSAEWLVALQPAVAAWFGWCSIFSRQLFATWVVDFLFAFAFGIAFQFFTIRPMRGLSVGRGLVEAVKADALSLTSWQVGMYGFMAVAHFWIFGRLLGVGLPVASVEFWFMMQLAMCCGFLTAFPVNWWLIRAGIKRAM